MRRLAAQHRKPYSFHPIFVRATAAVKVKVSNVNLRVCEREKHRELQSLHVYFIFKILFAIQRIIQREPLLRIIRNVFPARLPPSPVLHFLVKNDKLFQSIVFIKC